MDLTGSEWILVGLDGSGRIWVELGGSGRIWMDLDGSGRILADLGGSGWICILILFYYEILKNLASGAHLNDILIGNP